jgi:hypothetical protein
MADHSVRFTVPYRDLGRADVKFRIYAKERRDTYLIGTLLVSHGALEWRSRKKHHKVKLSWQDFDRLMEKKAESR